jgi:tRNA-specific 2-thiouridylase
MRSFLDKYIAVSEGDIVDLEGKVLGKHSGIHHYTIGQRKGIGIAAAEPLYVVKLDPVMNRVIVGNRASAVSADCLVGRMNWVSIAEPTHPYPRSSTGTLSFSGCSRQCYSPRK